MKHWLENVLLQMIKKSLPSLHGCFIYELTGITNQQAEMIRLT